MNKKTICIICGVIILLIFALAFILPSNEDNSQNDTKSSISYFETAVEHLKSDNVSNGPIEKLIDGNKIIYYGDDILVTLSYKATNLNYSIGFDTKTSTYSITENRFINDIELSNMQYSEKWKSSKIETISYDLVSKMSKKYFE